MKSFIINIQQLKKALALLSPIIEKADIHAISDSILLSIDKNQIEIIGRNNEICIKAILPIINSNNNSFMILVNAKTLLHIVFTSTVESLIFEISGKNIEEGEGHVVIMGNSKSSLPLKSLRSYPEFPDITTGIYADIDIEEFVTILNRASSYVEKDSIAYNSGICCGNGLIVATDRLHGLFWKYKIPIGLFVISPSILKPLKLLESAKISLIDSPAVLGIVGKIGGIMVLLSISTLHDEYPLDRTKAAIKLWSESKTYRFSVNRDILQDAIIRMKGFIQESTGFIEAHISNEIMTLRTVFQQYESEEKLEYYGETPPIAFRMNFKYWMEVIKESSDIVNLIIIPQYHILNIRNENYLYSAAIQLIE